MASTHEQFNHQCKDTEFQEEAAWNKSPIWNLLLGHAAGPLDQHLTGLENLLVTLYQTHPQFPAIKDVVKRTSLMQPSTKGLICRRALLLLALNREREMASYFIEEERKLGIGVGPTRVALLLLDLLIPMYLADFAQDPDVLVRKCTQALAMGFGQELWEKEGKAHRDAAVHCTA